MKLHTDRCPTVCLLLCCHRVARESVMNIFAFAGFQWLIHVWMELRRDAIMKVCLMDIWQYHDGNMYEQRRPYWWNFYNFSCVLDPDCMIKESYCVNIKFMVYTLYLSLVTLLRSFWSNTDHVGFTYILVLNLKKKPLS